MMNLTLLVPNLLLWDGSSRVIGGLERYVWELIRVAREMGFSVEVRQNGDHDWEQVVDGVRIRGYGVAKVSLEAAVQAMQQDAQNILYTSILQHPNRYRPGAVVISHGVWWDDPSASYRRVQSSIEFCRQALEGPDKVIACDYNFLNVIRATLPWFASKIEVIPNFVDLDTFKPRPAKSNRESSSGVIRVLYPRRIDSCKGIDLFITLCSSLIKRYPNLRFMLAVDRNHPDFNEQVARALDEAGLSSLAEVRTYSFEEMPQVYQKADIAVIPSKFNEGLSFSCLEALSSGCAVVATNVGGLINAIIDGYNGFLVNPSVEELTSAVATLIEDQDLRRRLRKNARRSAEAFSVERWRKRWVKVLKEVYLR